MSIELVEKVSDYGTPPWVTFTFKMSGGNNHAGDVLRKVARAIPAAYMSDIVTRWAAHIRRHQGALDP